MPTDQNFDETQGSTAQPTLALQPQGLIVEVLGRAGAPCKLHKADRFPVRIGRAFDNDLVLSDPYVSPLHLIIEMGDNGWIAVDQNSTNGTTVAKTGPIAHAVEVQSGDQLLVGRTVLRLWSPSHLVPEALPLQPQRSLARRAVTPLLSIASICCAVAFIMLTEFLDTAKQAKPLSLLANALPLCSFPFLWAGIWASAGFIVRRRSRYGLQLALANGAFVCVFLMTAFAEYIDYFTSSVGISDLVQYAGMAILATLLLYSNIRIATGVGDARRAIISFVIGGAVVAAVAVTDRAESVENRSTPQYSRTMKPPYAKLAKSVALDKFIKDSERLFKEKKK
jgi:hypothetical protein